MATRNKAYIISCQPLSTGNMTWPIRPVYSIQTKDMLHSVQRLPHAASFTKSIYKTSIEFKEYINTLKSHQNGRHLAHDIFLTKLVFLVKCHGSLLPTTQLTISEHWSRYWIVGDKWQAISWNNDGMRYFTDVYIRHSVTISYLMSLVFCKDTYCSQSNKMQ